ncbi:hypothetical protein RNJ44_00855 [Nakaseomyces bracarensis]|uniref:Homing endonuclease LAGLIDADG domain-containing protein n=1 Tax=Nakaseomyces bracarensis TaxID=273131 RepID=A0ABR4NQF9_9SACH
MLLIVAIKIVRVIVLETIKYTLSRVTILTAYLDNNTYYPIRLFYNNRDWGLKLDLSVDKPGNSGKNITDLSQYFFFIY